MDEKKVFDLLEKIYIELQDTNGKVKKIDDDLQETKIELKAEISGLKSDVAKLGAKIDGEITDKLKVLSDEQAIMRSDIHEIKEHQQLHDIKFEDLKIAVNSLEHKQRDQEKEIWELRKVK